MTYILAQLEKRIFRIELMMYIVITKIGIEGLDKILPVISALIH